MKQVTQRLRDGLIEVRDVPAPALTRDGVLVDVRASLLSAGTERSKVQAGRASLIGKARSRPDQARKVIEKARRDGLRDTIDAVRMRLDAPSSIGYSAAGVVLAVGDRVRDIVPGTRVAIGGGDHAVHAEIDLVPGNLCVPLPDGIRFEEAAFATVGAIAMHGVRQAEVALGERVAVVGLGLVGRLTGQILRAAGCRVVGIDVSGDAVRASAADVDEGRTVAELEGGADLAGTCDAVLITAATASSDPVVLAAALCRDRGRVVIVGDVGMELPRAPYFDKELELRLSRSYGPGRYDREYEERGLDYPIGYVRWTERRNMRSFVELIAGGRLDVASLISREIPVEQAATAYEHLVDRTESPLGLILTYGETGLPQGSPGETSAAAVGSRGVAALVGVGSFAQRILVPALKDAGFRLSVVASARGLSAQDAAARLGFDRAGSIDEALSDPAAGLVVVATRHGSHAGLAARALRSGRSVFVEKPPALDEAELGDLRSARDASEGVLAVGFNRRHAPLAVAMADHLRGRGPLQILFRVNAGALPAGHWLNDLEDGGGRLLGEGCHFVDFCSWLVGAAPETVGGFARPPAGEPIAAAQSFAISLGFANGSIATILYAADGAPRLGKEYVEAHGGGRSARLDDFRSLTLFGAGRPSTRRDRGGDKGHKAQLVHLAAVLRGERAVELPDPLDTMAATLTALRDAQGAA